MSSKVSFLWATDDNHPAGANPWNGSPNKVEPTLGQQQSGFNVAEKPSAEKLNYMFNKICASQQIVQRSLVYTGDNLRKIARPGYVTKYHIDDADGYQRFYILSGANLYRSGDGDVFDAGTAHGATGNRDFAMFMNGKKLVLGQYTVRYTPTGGSSLTFATLTTPGHAEEFTACCVHYRTGGTDYIVAVGQNGVINRWDGTGSAWTDFTNIGTEDLVSVVSRNGTLVAAHTPAGGGSEGLVVSFNDGDTWINKSVTSIVATTYEGYQVEWCEDPAAHPAIPGVTEANGLWLATGDFSVFYSVDNGVTWVDVSPEVRVHARTGLETLASFGTSAAFSVNSGLATDGKRFYTKINSSIFWSEDGINWYDTDIYASGSVKLSSVIHPTGRGGGFVAIEVGGQCFTTPRIRVNNGPLDE